MENFNFETPRFEPAKQISKEEILKKAGVEDKNAEKSKIEELKNSIEAIKLQMGQVGDFHKISLEAKMAAIQKQLEEISNKSETIH